MSAHDEYRYNRLTWPEMNEAIGMQKLVILPTGSTEQHGKHMPLDTDVFLTESVCHEVGRNVRVRLHQRRVSVGSTRGRPRAWVPLSGGVVVTGQLLQRADLVV